MIAARLGAALGVPVATVQLAVRVDRCGVVSRRVFDDDADSLVHGNELLADAGVVPRHAHDRAGYTVAAVAQALSTVGPPLAIDELPSAFDRFAGYLVLDALIGNTTGTRTTGPPSAAAPVAASRRASITPPASGSCSATKSG